MPGWLLADVGGSSTSRWTSSAPRDRDDALPHELQSARMRVKSHFATKDPSVFATYRRVVDVARTFGPDAQDAKKTSIHLVRQTAFAGIATQRASLVLTLK